MPKRSRSVEVGDTALATHLPRLVWRWRAKRLQHVVATAASRVYAELSWGWREDTYREALAVELQRDGHCVQQEMVSPIYYRGQPLSHVGMRADLVVNGWLVVELKVCGDGAAMLKALQQCRRYLRNVPQMRAGLVLNFPDKAGKAVVHIPLGCWRL